MAIDRGPWNALVDDDGSNLTGSIWNKAAIKTVILDPADGLIAPLALGTHHSVTVSGQLDNYNPGAGASKTLWLLSASATSYLTGIVAPAADGTLHLLLNTGPATINLTHLFASAVPNQIVGAGYTSTNLPPWLAVWVLYSAGLQKWIVLSATLPPVVELEEGA